MLPADAVFLVNDDAVKFARLSITQEALKCRTLHEFIASNAGVKVFLGDFIAGALAMRIHLAALAVGAVVLGIAGRADINGDARRGHANSFPRTPGAASPPCGGRGTARQTPGKRQQRGSTAPSLRTSRSRGTWATPTGPRPRSRSPSRRPPCRPRSQ